MMFATKINLLLELGEQGDSEDWDKFAGYVRQYFETVQPPVGKILDKRQIIRLHLGSLTTLKSYLETIRKYYNQAQGNFQIFQRLLNGGEKVLAIDPTRIGQNYQPNLYYLLFHLLVGEPISEVSHIVVFTYWDRLVIQCILAWCYYLGFKIDLTNLFKILDNINMDRPGVFPIIKLRDTLNSSINSIDSTDSID